MPRLQVASVRAAETACDCPSGPGSERSSSVRAATSSSRWSARRPCASSRARRWTRWIHRAPGAEFRRGPLAFLLLLLLGGWISAHAPAALPPHEGSLSYLELRVGADAVDTLIRVQARSLDETLYLDEDLDGRLSEAELEAARAKISAYVLGALTLRPGSGAPALAGSLGTLTPTDTVEGGEPMVEARLRFETTTELRALEVSSYLFLEQNPDHREFVSAYWGEEAAQEVFGSGFQSAVFEPADVRRPRVLIGFFKLGVEHIAFGYDHLCFLLALLVMARGLRSLVGVVTAFSVAHSVTLALAVLDVVRLPSHLVELAIALSIAYVASDNLLRRELRTPWLEAFLFGLLHGFGFAGFLGDALAGETLLVSALLGFNLGVETGQVGAVLAMALLFQLGRRLARRVKEEGVEGVCPLPLRVPLSALVALVGFYWFLERAGWLPG